MKIILLIIFSFASLYVTAQRLYRGERSISITGGLQDNFYFQKQDNAGFFANISYSKITKKKNRWVFGINGSVKHYEYFGQYAPVSQFVGDAAFYTPFIKNYRKNWIISVGVGGNVGYEVINAGSKALFKNGAAIAAKNQFEYGGFVGLENELYISNDVIWIVNFKERLLYGSDFVNTHWNFGTGFKFSLKN